MSERDILPPGSSVPRTPLDSPAPASPPPEKLLSKPVALIQLIVFSAIGLVMFFVPFTIGEKSTILFDRSWGNLSGHSAAHPCCVSAISTDDLWCW